MSGFDPDAFLAAPLPTSGGSFDPDAFLGQRAPQVGPWETFTNKAASALPLGKQIATGLTGAASKAFGMGDPSITLPAAALAEAKRLGIELPQAKTLREHYQRARGDFEERTEAGSKENPWASGLGTATGVGLSLAAPLPKVTVGSGAAGRLGSGALTGGAYGLLNGAANSRGDLTQGEVGQVLSDAVGVEGLQRAAGSVREGKPGQATLDVMGAGGIGGALTGGVLTGAGEGVRASGAVPASGELLRRFAERKALNSLGAGKPQLNALGSERAQDLGRYAMDKGIVSPLASRSTMAERIAAQKGQAGRKLGGALEELDAAALPTERINPLSAAERVEQLAEELSQQPALTGIANKFRNEAANIRQAAGQGASPGGSSLQDFERNVARPYKQTTNWNADLALPKETLKRLPGALEAEVERAAAEISRRTGSDAAQRYAGAKGDYGKLAGLADVAEEGLKKQSSNLSFGLRDALSGVAGATAGGPVGGVAGLVGGKLLSRFGDQLSATGANALGKALARSPGEAGGRGGQLSAILQHSLGSPRLTPSAQISAEELETLKQYAEALRKEKK